MDGREENGQRRRENRHATAGARGGGYSSASRPHNPTTTDGELDVIGYELEGYSIENSLVVLVATT